MSTSGKRNVACPHCATQLALDFSMAPGTAVMCPVCQQTLLVPDWGAAAVPEPVAEITIVPAAGSAGAAAVGAGAGAAPADAPLQAAAPPAAASPAADSASAASEPAAAASSGPSGAAPAPVAASPASDAAAAAAPRSPPEHKRTGVAADSAASAASLSAAGAGPPVTSSRSPLLERKRGSIMSVQGHTFTPLRGPAPKPGSPESKVSPTAPADGKATPDGGAGKVVAGADGKQQHSHAHVHVDWKTVLSDQQIAECREIFEEFDADGNGTISAAELETVMKLLGAEMSKSELQVLLNDIDTDGSGAIDISEFLTLFARLQVAEGSEQDFKVVFEKFDHNQNGLLTLPELTRIMQEVDRDATQDELRDMIAEFGTAPASGSGDRGIDLAGFIRMMS